MMLAIHLKTKHDSNGNARRLFLVMDEEEVKQVIIDGHGSRKGLLKYGISDCVTEIIVPVAEYNDWIRFGKEHDILTYDR